MLCKITGLKPGKCVHNIGDLHLYSNQIEVVKQFISNKPETAFPFMQINNNKINGDIYLSMDDFNIDDFKVIIYNSHKKYSIPFSV
jgi:thymidylate synthase